MVEIQIEYKGHLRCQATHIDSGVSFVTDAPKDNMGLGNSFSPTDLCATALGTCMMTVMGIAAQRMGLDLGAARVIVTKDMVSDPLRRIGRVAVQFKIPAKLDPEQRQQLENAANSCPVCRSLADQVLRPVTFEWGV